MTRIIVIGQLKTEFVKSGVKQYLKWLKKYENIKLIELPISGDLNKLPSKSIKDKDFEKMQKFFEDSYNIFLDERGKELDSIGFAEFYDKIKSRCGKKFLSFYVGGPLGHSEKVYDVADDIISLSKFTFTHEYAVLLILEQIFRSNKILNNESYHY